MPLPRGFTDNPPHILSGRQLFHEWITRDLTRSEMNFPPGERRVSNGSHEYKASDGSFMLWVGLYDFDYKRGYLIEVRSDGQRSEDKGAMCDWLFGWERYGGKNDYDVEWQNTPCHIFSEIHRDHSAKAMLHLPGWCMGMLEADHEAAHE